MGHVGNNERGMLGQQQCQVCGLLVSGLGGLVWLEGMIDKSWFVLGLCDLVWL